LKKFQQKGRSTSPVTESLAKERRKSDSFVNDMDPANPEENGKTEVIEAPLSSKNLQEETEISGEMSPEMDPTAQKEPIASPSHVFNDSETKVTELTEEMQSLKAELESKKNYIELLNRERSEQAQQPQSRHVISMLEQELDNERKLTHQLEEIVNSLECAHNETQSAYEAKIIALNDELKVVRDELSSKSDTIGILIEEKNDVSSAHNHSRDLIQSLEKELTEERQKNETLSLHLKELEETCTDVKNSSNSKIAHLVQELDSVKEELESKNHSLAETKEELE
jgi:chromosome segregation ATPase